MTQIDPSWPSGDGEMAGRIRTYDWSATPLGPVSGWSERLKVLVEQVLGSPLVSTLACGPQRLLLYNDAAARLFGDHHPAALGRPLPDAFPEGWTTVAPYYVRAFAGETVQVSGQPLDTRGEGVAMDVFDALLAPVRESGGSIAYVHMTGAEIGDRVRTEVARRESETRHRLLIESRAQAVWETDAAGVVVTDSLSWRAYTGQTLEEWLGYGWLEAIHPDDRAYAERQWREAIAARGFVNAEFRLRAPDGGWRWTNVRAAPVLDAGGQIEKWVGMNLDIEARKRAEAALRESGERQAFLLKLSDELRRLTDAIEIQAIAARVLAEHLGTDRAYYVSVDEGRQIATIAREYRRNESPSIVGEHRLADFSPAVGDYRAGKRVIIEDVEEAVSPEYRPAYRAVSHIAFLGIPLIKDGELVCVMAVASAVPRRWTEDDIFVVGETAERTWASVERARAEERLRGSEERFQQFARASLAGLWIRDADTLAMEFVSPAIGNIYGIEPDALLGDVTRWAAMIVPEERDTALSHLEAARRGEVATHEFRIQRSSDGAFRWIRNTEFPLRDDGRVLRIGGIAEDVTEKRQLTEHQGVLLAELQHRVRNIMAMIRSMANRTAPGASGVEDYRSLLEGRLLALARVQALLTREANAGGCLKDIIESEVGAQAHHGGQYALTGSEVQLAPKAVEVLTLAFHELATNALKYGALSDPEGRLSVRWAHVEKKSGPWLSLDWVVTGAPPREPSKRRGFGSELIEGRIPYELGGRGTISIGSDGARCHLEFPLKDGESILETDAPLPTTVFGGSLDMTGATDLTGRRVLVVEDDYYLASDTAAALRGAGAEVLGPCPNEDAARALLEEEAPTHAILDLNLGGGGPRFEIAHLLKARGIPFVFLTGYDPNQIPAGMRDVVRLEKPLPYRAIVEAVGQL